jgi:hypothetical protein
MNIEEKHYASRGVGGTALGLAIGSLGAQVLNGGLSNLFGGGAHCGDGASSIATLAALSLGSHASGNGENAPVNRYELGLQKEITNRDMEIAFLRGRDAAKEDTIALYRYIDGKFEAQNAKIAEQAVFNATATATMNCMGGQIAQLFALTKLVIPNSSSCPGWGNVTITPAATAAAG